MKKFFFPVLVMISCSVFSQVPHAFNYQAIARDSAGNPITNRNISVRISIINAVSTVEYSELHLVATNRFGLFTLKVGQPTSVVSGSFGSITWNDSVQNIKVELDPNAGTNFSNMGTSQLLSVPYALTAGSKISFGARYSGGLNMTPNTTAQVPFDVTDFNDGNGFNTTTNNFTAPEDGLYQFNAVVEIATVCGSGYSTLRLHKNGTIVFANSASSTDLSMSLSTAVKLLAGDIISVIVYDDCTSNMQFGASYPEGTFFNGYKVY